MPRAAMQRRGGKPQLLDRIPAPAAAFAAFALVFTSSFGAAYGLIQKDIANERILVLTEAAIARARLESELYSRISLEQGLVSYISLNPAMTAAEFESFSRSLIGKDEVIRNVSVLKGTVISFVHPQKGNESALGRDLAEVPAQRDDVLWVRDSGKTLVVGPVDLVQGGRGIISRMPVYATNARGGPSYWGQASIVVSADKLFAAAGTFAHPGIRVALRTSGQSAPLEGDGEVFASDPVLMDVHLPGSTWQLAAIPEAGWKNPFSEYLFSLTLLVLFSAAVAYLAHAFVSARAKMQDMAFHDPLTELPNRAMFWDRLSVSLSLAKREGKKVALCMVDLDRFKEINDRHGHAAGDAVLVETARRLLACIRESDTVARLGGDEFAVVTVFEPSQGAPEAIAERILGEFHEGFSFGGEVLRFEASLGLALWPDDGESPEQVLAVADARMYAMKRGSGGPASD